MGIGSLFHLLFGGLGKPQLLKDEASRCIAGTIVTATSSETTVVVVVAVIRWWSGSTF